MGDNAAVDDYQGLVEVADQGPVGDAVFRLHFGDGMPMELVEERTALPATTLVIFGNPKAGTPLMQCSRTAAIDLPNKALVWAENGKTWIAVNDMDYLAQRHHMTDCPAVPKVADKLRQLVGQTVAQ